MDYLFFGVLLVKIFTIQSNFVNCLKLACYQLIYIIFLLEEIVLQDVGINL
jgi:hypothetical protein